MDNNKLNIETVVASCCNCKYFFKGPKGRKSFCIRYPEPKETITDGICGEHPGFIRAPVFGKGERFIEVKEQPKDGE